MSKFFSDVTVNDASDMITEAVKEYRDKQKEVVNNFVLGMVELGSILYKHRETWKQSRVWLKYCEELGIHISTANQQIRLYEFYKNSGEKLLVKNIITNWSKLHLFLALDNEGRTKLLESGVGEDTPTDEFKDLVNAIRGKDQDEDEDVIHEIDSSSLEGLTIPKNMPSEKAAQVMGKALGMKSTHCIQGLEALVHIMKAKTILSGIERNPYVTPKDLAMIMETVKKETDSFGSAVSSMLATAVV